ncbi:unnamed protein product [Owenia fusiformis]|uniref:G-protein coupled receptors family 3 profile domain-containing protein n=1 Tax=Owenia fusiformis TaxID=6347 RepID=A0A8S4PIR0_OWEFU|nr:unnamed protein product [Owenia fusiformis]
MVITMALIVIQIGITIGVLVTAPPNMTKKMPVESEKYVELSCDFPVWSMIISIIFNLLLVLATATLAFLTRKLPDNFNETMHILLSVCATVFLWLSFIPTYFITDRAKHQQMLFSVMFLLTGAVSILCLFAPRIYAVIFVDESKIKFSSTFAFKQQIKTFEKDNGQTSTLSSVESVNMSKL